MGTTMATMLRRTFFFASVLLAMLAGCGPSPRQSVVPAGQTVFNFGVTGKDWPDAKVSAAAWKLDLRDAAGAAVATEKSYLWERPGK